MARIKRERAAAAAAASAAGQQVKRGKSSRERGYQVVDATYDDDEDWRGRDKRRSKRLSVNEHQGNTVKRRVVSGAAMEEGRSPMAKKAGTGTYGIRGGGVPLSPGDGTSSYDSWEKDKDEVAARQGGAGKWWKRKKLWILTGVVLVVTILIIAVAVVVSNNKKGDDDGGGTTGKTDMSNGGLNSISPSSIPPDAPNYLNPFKWADTTDFNLTYTEETVGDLPLMGLYSSWDDSARPNDRVPPLNKPWGPYTERPARGVNVGGWLSLEPFITPSLFTYPSRLGIIDEYTLCKYLGARCESVLEQHYSTFVTESTFREIAEAGLDHVRIPFSYWAIQTYEGDPYLFRTSWRYLLRAIEWARKYGLRINLDPHGLPGSQNGWNHSGRQGTINWLSGPSGDINSQRSLEMHDRLSKFFSQPRYRNIITHYGLANEPKMTSIPPQAVIDWTKTAHDLVRKNGIKDAIIIFGDGFRGLNNWQGDLPNIPNLALDVHQYLIFNTNQIVFNHSEKIRYACQGWRDQIHLSMNPDTGYGPTLIAEWSQADTDCAKHLTNVGWGNRWTGTYITNDPTNPDVITPRCPTMDRRCDCIAANAPPEQWSDEYKRFLKMFAEAQMSSFEKSWGWFYWVWDTEDAPQWSYKKGMAAGVLPSKAYEREFDCNLADIPDFGDLPEYY
ncbi:Glycoside hydrolase superfamily [Rhypophila sp. PSN 637]